MAQLASVGLGSARPPKTVSRPSAGERIGIIGAGAAGLAIAHRLRALGYRAVTVLEKDARVGGKCCTIHYEGRSFELGAAVLSPAYKNVRALAREVGLETTTETSGFFVDLERQTTRFLVPDAARQHPLRLARELPRYVAALAGERRLWSPGLDGLPADFARPFEEWARTNGYSETLELVRPWFTGFGYGYMSEIPAAYVLKYMTLSVMPLSELLDGGYQALWERVARPLDVRYGVDVRRVVRDASGVVVETDRETLRFDRLILACPLDRALAFLDASGEEKRLFGQIRYVDYRVVAAFVEAPSGSGPFSHRYTFANRLLPDQRGEPMFWYRRWADHNLHTFYSIGGPDLSDEEIVARIDRAVSRLGGKLGKVVRSVKWAYFPHVGSQAFADGYYSSLEALQGARRTYYAGELLCFPTVETVTAYSFDLARRFFDTLNAADELRTGS
jgi:protoporphyrinogen oxidase